MMRSFVPEVQVVVALMVLRFGESTPLISYWVSLLVDTMQ